MVEEMIVDKTQDLGGSSVQDSGGERCVELFFGSTILLRWEVCRRLSRRGGEKGRVNDGMLRCLSCGFVFG